MNTEPSVQGEVLYGIIEPMNALLKVNFIATEVLLALSIFQTRYPLLSVNNNLSVNDRYPRWSRSCSALHNTPGSNNNAGYPDFILLRSAAPGDNAAVAEVKTWWAYPTAVFDEIFRRNLNRDGRFNPHYTHPSGKLLKQLWGQLHYFNCQLGFCTNGRAILFFVRAGVNGTLVVSEKMDWDDPRAGLSFSAVDLQHLDGLLRNGLKFPFIDSYLCPKEGRRSSWT